MLVYMSKYGRKRSRTNTIVNESGSSTYEGGVKSNAAALLDYT
jgi:hypothetical protein